LGVNVPIAIIAVLLAVPYLHESKAPGDRSYDIPGAITSTLGLLSLVYGFSQAVGHGWGNSATYRYFIFSAIFLVAFTIIESKVKNPLLPLRVLTERNRGGSYIASILVGTGLFAMFLFLSIYMQSYIQYMPLPNGNGFMHYSSLRSGFAFLPFSAGVIVFAGVASQLLPKVGPRPLMVAGLIGGSVGLLYLSRITPTSSYTTSILPAMIIMSSGLALFFIPTASTGLHNSGEHDAGVASAVLNTSQQIGGSLGAALLNTLAISSTAAYIKSHKVAPTDPAAAVHGFSTTFIYGAGFLFLAAIVTAVMINVGKDSLTETDGVVVH
jgi:hypothetical protein